MDGRTDGWTDGWVGGWMDGQMDGWTDRWTDRRTGGRTDAHEITSLVSWPLPRFSLLMVRAYTLSPLMTQVALMPINTGATDFP